MVNSEQKGQEEKEVALNHAHVPTLVNIRIGECLVGNTEVLRNHTADRKHNFNAVCHLIMTILALRICTATFPTLLRLSCLLPSFVSTLAPTCPGSHGGHIHKQDQPWPEHGGIVCCQTRSPTAGRKLCAVQKAAANSARCLHQSLASEHATISSMFNSSKTEHTPSRVLRPDNIM
jgi:hypothetical protein